MTIFALQMPNPDQIVWDQTAVTQEDQVWWKWSVFYHIYPRSFQDSNGDGVGDLQGIIDRLDYLEKLGIGAIWISPIYPSPQVDFGYDVTDYCDIDPLFGTLETFDRLLDAAHARGIKVVLDYVANHTSDEHPWFIESRSSQSNPKRDWYIWSNAKENGELPNNWVSFFGGSAWTWDTRTQQYYLHLFSDKQPDLNWRNPQVIKAMHDVLRFWLDRGVDGFRMDAVTLLMKHANLPDMPPAEGLFGAELLQQHIYAHDQPEVHDLIRDFRQLFDSYSGHRVIIGETSDLNPKKLAFYYGADLDEMHLPFNFTAMHTPWEAADMKRAIINYLVALPPKATPNFVFGNHDISRLATRYGWENHRSVGMLLLTLGGVATLYYGDELGMTDGHVPSEKIQDPMGKRYPGLGHGRDPARTPMQWNTESNSGFTLNAVEPWLPLADNHRTVNAAVQARNPRSTLRFYQALIRLKRELPALQYGSFAFVDGTPDDVMAYLRRYNGQRLLIIINFSNTEFRLNLSKLARSADLRLSSEFTPMGLINIEKLVVKAHESLLLELAWAKVF